MRKLRRGGTWLTVSSTSQRTAFKNRSAKPTITIYQASIKNLAVGSRVTDEGAVTLALQGVCLLVQELSRQKSLIPNGIDRRQARVPGGRLWLMAGSGEWTPCAESRERNGNRRRPGSLGRRRPGDRADQRPEVMADG